MRIMLVTTTNFLNYALYSLNGQTDFCAVVTDDIEQAKNISANYKLPETLLHPIYELKECCRDFYFDLCIAVTNWETYGDITEMLKEYGLPKEKFLLLNLFAERYQFLLSSLLKYYRENLPDCEIFATGISYSAKSVLSSCFKKKLINFAGQSQDLYYDFKVAKEILSTGGGANFKYALIGLAPYSFHWDESKGYNSHWYILQYYIAFKDLHNFRLSPEEYGKIFRTEFFEDGVKNFYEDYKKSFNIDNPVSEMTGATMTQKFRVTARKMIDEWQKENRNYPETVAENRQILDDYLTLCESKNIRPIMFLPPMTEGYKKYFDKKRYDEFLYYVNAAVKKHSTALFLNGWNIPGFTDKYFYDAAHMNIHGAEKFSTIFNDVIESLE